MEFRNDIQLLRGVSVLFVVLYHLEIPGFSSGLLGVDIFFVISGYLMAILVDKGTALDFYKRRIRRLAPAYFLTVAITVIVAAVVTVPVDFRQVVEQSIYSLLFANNVGFWLQNSYFNKVDFNPLLNLWSLGVEVQFYLIAPFLLALLKGRKILLGLAIIASIVMCILAVGVSPKTAFFHLPFRIWEFLIGVCVAWYFTNISTNRKSKNLATCILMAALCLVLLLPMTPENRIAILAHPGVSALLICTITGLIITLGLSAELTNNMLGRSLVLLGKYSYSIYLVHFPVIVLFNYSAFNGTSLGFSSLADLGILLSTVLVLSFLLHHGVETRNKFIFKSIIPYCLVIALGLGAYLSSHYNTSRYTDQQNLIFAAWTDRTTYRCGKVFRILNPTKQFCKLSPEITEPKGSVLLIGTSHADALKTSFTSVYAEKGFEVLFYVNNEPLRSSAITVESIVNDAIELNVSSVVLHYHGNAYNEKLVGKISELSNKLNNIAVPLVLLSPVPTYNYHVPKYLYSVSEKNAIEKAKSLDQQRQANQFFWETTKSEPWAQITIVETATLLCPDGTCLRVNDAGKPLYFDDSHLTLTGSDYLKPIFKQMVNKLDV